MIPLLLALAAIAAQSTPTIPPAQLDESLDIQGESLAARQVETRLSLAVDIDRGGPFRFLVDSGADRSVIGALLAARLHLPDAGSVTVNSIAGQSRQSTVLLENLHVGTLTIPAIVAPALPERFLGAQGILGIDALIDQRLMLDFDAKTITIQNAAARPAIQSDEIVVTARRRHGQLILTQVTIDGVPAYAIIDTGSEITVGNIALLNRIFRGHSHAPSTTLPITSVTGQSIDSQLMTISNLRVASLGFEKVSIAFADLPPFALFGLADQPALLLGTDVLQTFRRVSLDFRARKVRFQLRHQG